MLLPTRADLGSLLRHVRQLGLPVGSSDHLYSEALYLTDPDGITIEIYRDRPRSEWLVSEQGEIITALDPLREAEVLAAGAGQPWTGLPAGTTMGHLHFYVGDIAAARAFYFEGLGLAQTLWSLPTATFLGAGGYHHHVGVNVWAMPASPATPDDARLLTWEWLLPSTTSVTATADSLRRAGFAVATEAAGTFLASDPWGITVRLVAANE